MILSIQSPGPMDLLSYTKQSIHPSEDQAKLLKKLDAFLKSEEKCFLLKGYAGTGKTTLTKFIANYLVDKRHSVHLLAPTGRAARILSFKTKLQTSTIHRGIYQLNHVDEIETQKDKRKFKFKYQLQIILPSVTHIYLIDEASMISDKYSESDFFVFGSGYLLKDLLDHLALTNNDRKNKVIFIGDPAQLPPVGDNISGALDSEYLMDQHGVKAEEYELTEVARQEKESGILKNTILLRNLLEQSKQERNFFKFEFDQQDMVHSDVSGIVHKYKESNPKLDTNKAIVINHSNRSALDFNLLIRAEFFPDPYKIEAGDTLLINQNNYNYIVELFNGTLVKVKSVDDNYEVKRNMLAYDENGQKCQVEHKFRDIVILAPNEHGAMVEIRCKILENFLYSPEGSMSYAENIALYLDFKMRHPKLKPKTKEFADALRLDPYFNALRVKYGYALTCHKAQGGEWETVFVNMDVNIGRLSDTYIRWTYTALTRASKRLFVFNYQSAGVFSKLFYKPARVQDSVSSQENQKSIVFQLPENIDEILVSFNLHDQPDFLKQKFIQLLAITNSEGIDIFSRVEHAYLEVYTFRKGTEMATMKFYYNGKKQFTKIEIQKKGNVQNELSTQLYKLLNEPLNLIVIGENEPEDTPGPPDFEKKLEAADKKHIKVLYLTLLDLLIPKEIKILNIEFKDFYVLLFFQKERAMACIQFYYDKNMSFTHASPMIKECNSNELLADLEAAIRALKD